MVDTRKWEEAAGSWNSHADEIYATAKRKRMGPGAQRAERLGAKGASQGDSQAKAKAKGDSQALETGQVFLFRFWNFLGLMTPFLLPFVFSSFEMRKHLTAVWCLSHHCIFGEDNLFSRFIDIEEFSLGWLILMPHPCLAELMRFGTLIWRCNELKVWGMLEWNGCT